MLASLSDAMDPMRRAGFSSPSYHNSDRVGGGTERREDWTAWRNVLGVTLCHTKTRQVASTSLQRSGYT